MSDNVTKGVDEKFCSSCGAIIKIAAEICPKCGVRQKGATGDASDKSKTTAALLCFFLGTLGVHRFYVGKTGTGIAQLLVSIVAFVSLIFFFLAGIWPLIDFIIILSGNFKDREGKIVLNW